MEIAQCYSCKTAFDKKAHIPRMLPQCGHTFCDSCIRKSFKASRRTFTCPIDKQTQVLWKEIDELPINKPIYDTLLSRQHSTKAQSGLKFSFNSSMKDESIRMCLKHNKPLEFTCRHDNEEVCVDCLLFTNHKNHEFYRSAGQPEAGEIATSPRTHNRDSLSSSIPVDKMTALTKQILEEPNSIQKALNLMKTQLRNQVTEIFKSYHEKLFQQQQVALLDVDKMVKKCQSKLESTRGRLKDHLKCSQKIQKRAQDLKRNSSGPKQIDQIIKQINKFSDEIVDQDRKIQESIEAFTQSFKQQLKNTEYWRAFVKQNQDLKENKEFHRKSHSRSISCTKSEKSVSVNSTSHLQIRSNYHKGSPAKDVLTDRSNKQNLKQKNSQNFGLEGFNEYNPSFWGQASPSKCSSLNTKLQRSVSSNSCNNGRSGSREKRPEQKFENRCKIDSVIDSIRKQPAPNIELIDLQIKDYFIPSIIDAIKSSGKKIGVLKLVKNQLTDEGFKMLLKGFRDYPYLHSLNVTSNQLTEECLDSILEFRLRNKSLANFYLAGNCMSGSKCRQKKRIMYEYGINLFL